MKAAVPMHGIQLYDNKGQKSRNILKVIKRDYAAWLMMLPSLIIFTFFIWQPIVSGAILSFFSTKGFKVLSFTGFNNYIEVIKDPDFISALKNSFSYTIWSLILGFLIPIIAAIAINEMVHMQSLLKFAVYFPGVVPGMAALILWQFLFDPGESGIINSVLIKLGLPMSGFLQDPRLTIPLIILTLTWKGFGGTAIVYLARLQSINLDLYESSALDGANIIQKVWHVTLPQISNLARMLLMVQIISVFQILYEPMVMTNGGPNNASLSLMELNYNYIFKAFSVSKSMALSMIICAILAVFTLVYFKLSKETEVE